MVEVVWGVGLFNQEGKLTYKGVKLQHHLFELPSLKLLNYIEASLNKAIYLQNICIFYSTFRNNTLNYYTQIINNEETLNAYFKEDKKLNCISVLSSNSIIKFSNEKIIFSDYENEENLLLAFEKNEFDCFIGYKRNNQRVFGITFNNYYVYKGYFISDNIFTRKGTLRTRQFIYKGGFDENGKFNGYGILSSISSLYQGYFKNGSKYKLGRLELKNKNSLYSVYEGEFLNDLIEGKGFLQLRNGEYLKGEFKNNQICGNGIKFLPESKFLHGFFIEEGVIKGKAQLDDYSLSFDQLNYLSNYYKALSKRYKIPLENIENNTIKENDFIIDDINKLDTSNNNECLIY